MRFASSRQLLPPIASRQVSRGPSARVAAGVSVRRLGIEAMGACMLIAVFLAIAMLG